MLQLSHSGCSCLLCLTFIGNINASTDHKRQISNVVGNAGYNFSGFFWSKSLAGTCGSELWLNRGWCPLVGRDPSEPSALICSHHIPPPLPLHFLHPFPLFKNSFLLALQFCSSSCSCFLLPISSIPSTPRASLPCPCPRGAAPTHSSPEWLQQSWTQLPARDNLSTAWMLHSKLWMCILGYASQKQPLTPGISSPSALSF